MKAEIELAARFIVKLAFRGPENVNTNHHQRLLFFKELMHLLRDRFTGHWYPKQPMRGQGYRCLRFNQISGPDSLILRAARRAGFQPCQLVLPVEMSLWIDPGEVTAKIGEDGSVFPVTVDVVEWPDLRPDPRAKTRPSQRHFIQKRRPIQQPQVEPQMFPAYAVFNQFMQFIGFIF